ncbi:MAG: hypothetical protein CVU41_17205 [Chloroflexi bacterium HGW-Chloroflexi-3]|nr:MAG: hypothetical protein CVU41_17205 [Chloroflexi bacterium HGW-Chloroflexi-3]
MYAGSLRNQPAPHSSCTSYWIAPDSPDWGWRTEIQPQENGELVITHYGVTPEGLEWKGVETVYQRM